MARISRATSRNCRPILREIQPRQRSRCISQRRRAGRRVFSFFALRCAPKRDHGWIFAGAVHRESVANCSCVFARVANVVQVSVPALDIPTVRRLRAPGNWDVTIFGEGEKRTLAGQWKRRCPVWRKPHETFSREIEREHGCSITTVKVEIEERQTQCPVEQKMAFGILPVMQDSKCSFKSWNISEWRLGSGFQIAQ